MRQAFLLLFHTHTHMRIHARAHTHTHTHTHTYADTPQHAFKHTHTPTHTQTYTHMYTHTHTHTNTHMHTHMHAHTHAHTHTHTQVERGNGEMDSSHSHTGGEVRWRQTLQTYLLHVQMFLTSCCGFPNLTCTRYCRNWHRVASGGRWRWW